MDLRDGPLEAVFRARVRAWMAERLTPVSANPRVAARDLDAARAWSKEMHQAGFAGLTWPVEYGGQGRPIAFEAIYLEEAARAGAPEHIGVIGLGMVGPTILAHGTSEQKATYLPRILSGDTMFCLGLSEPEAGSDLASVRTRALPDGDGFILNGQKVWSSYAHLADVCLVLARTGADDDRHRGLTCLLVDTGSPGVTVRPLRQLTGESEFSEIELSDVWVGDDRVLGAVGGGWEVAMTGLAHERGTMGFTLAARLSVQLRRLVETARVLGRTADPLVRDRIAAIATETAALTWTSYRALAKAGPSGTPGADSSVIKLSWSQTHQRLTAFALELLGAEAHQTGEDGFWAGYWTHHHLRSLGNSIEGGTSEIQRNVIAERLLGLPRGR